MLRLSFGMLLSINVFYTGMGMCKPPVPWMCLWIWMSSASLPSQLGVLCHILQPLSSKFSTSPAPHQLSSVTIPNNTKVCSSRHRTFLCPMPSTHPALPQTAAGNHLPWQHCFVSVPFILILKFFCCLI